MYRDQESAEFLCLVGLDTWRIALVSFPAESHETGQRIWRRHNGA